MREWLRGIGTRGVERTLVMGIVNLTPDSFSDGGELFSGPSVDIDRVLNSVGDMLEAGVDMVDVGGESTRPGASPVGVAEELDRVIAAITAIKLRFDVPVSIDTSRPEVIDAAAAAGAELVNDVRALQRPGALAATVDSGLPVCLMHMQNQPSSMQSQPQYVDVVGEVKGFLMQRREQCIAAGVDARDILIDPGFGFGKTTAHNLTLFKALDQLVAIGVPLLVGMSRKRMIGELLNASTDQRLIGSVTMALLAAQKGAAIVRVHDVTETVQALKMLHHCE
jgi:dihydropteroate synthase